MGKRSVRHEPPDDDQLSPFVNVVAATDSAHASTGGDTVADAESGNEAATDIVVDEASGESASRTRKA